MVLFTAKLTLLGYLLIVGSTLSLPSGQKRTTGKFQKPVKEDLTVGEFLASLKSNTRSELSKVKGQNVRACSLSQALIDEIASYQPIVNQIIETALQGEFRGRTYDTLARFVDKYGSRLSGSKALEDSIDYMVDVLKNAGLENVHTEEALVPHWVRGNESLTMMEPRVESMSILGLGKTVGTPPGGITAPVLVVRSFEELLQNSPQVAGKIVVFNEPFTNYGETVQYRAFAAVSVAKLGGVAALIRSVTPYSLDTPHTGDMNYEAGIEKIPSAAISIENAELLNRLQNEGETIVLRLVMEDQNFPDAVSRNTIAEIVGEQAPQKVVLVSGHLDSWDVGQGAMDDGGGSFISWTALALLQHLGLRARRSLRVVLWTAEEQGYVGAAAYLNNHLHELQHFDLVMESDVGTFLPQGLSFSGSEEAQCIMQEILKLTQAINTTTLVTPADVSDVELFMEKGVPGAGLLNADEQYFWYHHTKADMMTVEDTLNLDLGTALFAISSYIVADLSVDLPRA